MRRSLTSVVTAATVAGAALFILLQLQPGLLVANTTPAGGDMGAHVWGPAYLRDSVLPHFRLTGWTPDWYAGFPAYHFYFPLPMLAVVALDLLLPYGVAFKLVTVVGLVALPVAAWFFGTRLRLPFPTPALLAAATVPFVFDRFHTIWGGNAAATLAGEFSFSIALALALVFLGVLAGALETGRGFVLAAALFAATALCHLLPTAFAVGGAVLLLLTRRPDRVRWALVVVTGLLGTALGAFWLLPFFARLQYSNDMGWERTYAYLDNLFPFLRDDDAARPVTTQHLKVVLVLAVVGVVLGLVARRRGVVVLTLLAGGAALAFRLVPEGPIWNARLLPFWYLTLYFLAAVGVGEAARILHRVLNPPPPPDVDPDDPAVREPVPIAQAVAAAGGIVTVVLLTGIPLGVFSGRLDLPGDASLPFVRITSADSNFVPAWARWNYSGYERKDAQAEYFEVIRTMADVGEREGCGRAMWEYEPELNRFGTPMGLMLLPYWTDGCIGSMEGLYFESSATVPYHFLNQSELSRTPSRAMRDLPYRGLDVNAGVEHLRLLGVRYYLAISPDAQAQAATNPNLRLLATTSPYQVSYSDGAKERFWQVYEVLGSELVTPLRYEPVVVEKGMEGKHGWLDAAVAWYQDPARWDVPLAVDGPRSWSRIPTPESTPVAEPVPEARVTNIDSDEDSISFDVDRVGVPVLVRASYFPNWKASGARGPWRVTPNLMVVVPTDEHVELRYGWTFVDIAGWLVTLAAIAGAVALARRGSFDLPEPPRQPETFVDPFAVPLPEEDGDRAPLAVGGPHDPAP